MYKGEDFNKFTCGNYFKTKKIPDDSSSIDTFYEIEETLTKNLIGIFNYWYF